MVEEKGIEQAVEESNTRFYMAFESLSIERMELCWKHSDNTVCIHPGWEMFTGWTAIRESWVSIFENSKKIEFYITNIKIRTFDNLAIVVCLENIDSLIDNENSLRTGIIATNVFEHNLKRTVSITNNQWLMIHHHGSSIANYIPPNISV